MKTSVEHLESAIKEVEDKVSLGHVSREDADTAIAELRGLHERLTRIEEKLLGRRQSK